MINYVKGDATYPMTDGPKVIVHICNDIGAWGKGFVLALSKRWSAPEKAYREWPKNHSEPAYFLLGNVQFVPVENELWVANLIGQRHIKHCNDIPPVRYEAIRFGLVKVADFAIKNKASVHMPRIGCGLAGGTWDKIEPIIKETLEARNVKIFVYDL